MGNTVLRPAEEIEADHMENDDLEILDELIHSNNQSAQGVRRHNVQSVINQPYSGQNKRIINKGIPKSSPYGPFIGQNNRIQVYD